MNALVLLLIGAGLALGRTGEGPQGQAGVLGGLVSSREWKVRRAPEKEEEFIGDVRYRNAESAVAADWALYRHATQSWRARGHVGIEHKLPSGDKVSAKGSEATYDQRTRNGSLSSPERVEFTRTPLEGEPDHGVASRADWEGRERMTLAGLVHVWGPRLETWSDRAEFDHAAGTIRLTGGRPVLRKLEGEWTGAVQADEVRASEKPRRLSAEGKARGWIEFAGTRESPR